MLPLNPFARPVDCRCSGCGREFRGEVPVLRSGEVWRNATPPELCTDCRQAQREAEEEARARAEREARADPANEAYIRRLRNAGIEDRRLWTATLRNYDASDNRDALDAAVAFAKGIVRGDWPDDRRWLAFTGPPGNGKTHLLVGIDRALYVAGYGGTVALYTVPALVLAMQEAYGTTGAATALQRRLIGADVLLLDDVGRGKQSDDSVRIVTEVLDLRTGRETAISTNYTRNGLVGRHADYETTVSRMGPAYCRLVKMEGRDHRQERQS